MSLFLRNMKQLNPSAMKLVLTDIEIDTKFAQICCR